MKKILFLTILALGIRTNTQAQTTWAEHVAPILYNSCTNCHISGGIAPFSLVGYSKAVANANGIADATQKRRMPPWPANSNYKRYAHERILSAEENQNATRLGCTRIQIWRHIQSPGRPQTKYRGSNCQSKPQIENAQLHGKY